MNEKRLLQFAVGIAGLVPVIAGAAGALMVPGFLDLARSPQGETHVAYLSGLLLGIGLGFWSLIPAIEKQGRIFSLLTACVVIGGLARLVAAFRLQTWDWEVTAPLAMELGVTPLLWLWQRRISRRAH